MLPGIVRFDCCTEILCQTTGLSLGLPRAGLRQ